MIGNISRWYLENISSLKTLSEKSKISKEHSEIFLNKFYQKNPELKSLILSDFNKYLHSILDDFDYSDEEMIIKYLKAESVSFQSQFQKILFEETTLSYQIGNKFLNKYGFDNRKYLSKQYEYCLDNFKKDPIKYMNYIKVISSSININYPRSEIIDTKYLKKVDKYINKLEGHEINIPLIKLLNRYRNDISDNTYYGLYKNIKIKEIPQDIKIEMLSSYKDIDKKFFNNILLSITIDPKSEYSMRDSNKILKALENKDGYDEIKKSLNQIVENDLEYNKKVALTILTLGFLGASATSLDNSNDSSLNLVNVGVDMAIGAGVSSMLDL